MPRKKKAQPKPTERNTALIYVRQSFTKNEKDNASPERQRLLAQQRAELEGWDLEWYEDAEGHKSGRFVTNRPGWLELQHRLDDEDVKVVIAYDLARLHRKGWRIGDLLDQLEQREVDLVFTRPGYNMDTTTRAGKFLAQITAMLDEAYAEDVSQRTKAAIQVLRDQGKSVGASPFGTKRNEEGYLELSIEGAWFMPSSGRYLKGKPDDVPPEEGAIWRYYAECALYILTIYIEEDIGMDKIAYRLNAEGWPFRDRKGKPKPVGQSDVRRVIANWPDYGGMVPERRAKDRPGYDDEDPANMLAHRAVFPLELLQQVAENRRERTHGAAADDGVNKQARTYALSKLVYCAHCDALAQEQDDPSLRTRLSGGPDGRGKRRYKHKPGIDCGTHNRSVKAENIEPEFGRLLKLLTLKEDAIDYMTELAIQSQRGWLTGDQDEVDLAQERETAIALCNRRIDAAMHLYGDGRVSREEYLRRVEVNEREIAHWEARTSETEQKALELAMCVKAINRMSEAWDTASDEDKQGMAKYLFTEVVFDLDTWRIESYKLKPWADEFLMLRMDLYYQQFGEIKPGSDGYAAALALSDRDTLLGCCDPLPHRGTWGRSFPQVLFSVAFAMAISYHDLELPQSPVSDGTSTKCKRNAEIRARHQKGESIATLAEVFGITERRISQIIHGRRN